MEALTHLPCWLVLFQFTDTHLNETFQRIDATFLSPWGDLKLKGWDLEGCMVGFDNKTIQILQTSFHAIYSSLPPSRSPYSWFINGYSVFNSISLSWGILLYLIVAVTTVRAIERYDNDITEHWYLGQQQTSHSLQSKISYEDEGLHLFCLTFS